MHGGFNGQCSFPGHVILFDIRPCIFRQKGALAMELFSGTEAGKGSDWQLDCTEKSTESTYPVCHTAGTYTGNSE